VLDSWRAQRWRDKLRVWLAPPGWRPADVAAHWPKPAFDLQAVRSGGKYDPPLSRGAVLAALALFALLLAAVCGFLWFAQSLTPGQQAAAALGIVALLWAMAGVSRGSAATPTLAAAPARSS
jgi:hypothetical protein